MNNSDEQSYLSLLRDVLENGESREDRTGTGTLSVFGRQLRFSLADNKIPMITTRKTSFKIVLGELLWFVKGSTDSKELSRQGIRIWDGNSSREFLDSRGLHGLDAGDIGAGYGFQWRHFGANYLGSKTTWDPDYLGSKRDYAGQGVDQLEYVIKEIRENPSSRRICMTAWNPLALGSMALPPCHSCFVQFYVSQEKKTLSCHMYQRSVDCFLGLAINIPSYAILTNIIAKKTGLEPLELVISTGDTHIYKDHIDGVLLELERTPFPSPTLRMSDAVESKGFDELSFGDFELVGYSSHPPIRANMSI